jgi:hypothetical protein
MPNPIVYRKNGHDIRPGSLCFVWQSGQWSTEPTAKVIDISSDGNGRPYARIKSPHTPARRVALMLLHPAVPPRCYPAEPQAIELTHDASGLAWI